jgi:hypothetical protein
MKQLVCVKALKGQKLHVLPKDGLAKCDVTQRYTSNALDSEYEGGVIIREE